MCPHTEIGLSESDSLVISNLPQIFFYSDFGRHRALFACDAVRVPCHANRQAWGPRPRRPWTSRYPAVPTQATGRARIRQESSTAKLAKFFPEASPVRIPVRLTRVVGEGNSCSESTVIEFGTTREVLFSSTLPLEFGPRSPTSPRTSLMSGCNAPARTNRRDMRRWRSTCGRSGRGSGRRDACRRGFR